MESSSQNTGVRQKSITVLLTLACAGMVYLEVSGDPATTLNDAGVYASEHAPVPGLDGEKMFHDLGGAYGAAPVVMFVTPWCGVCRALEADLKKRNVPFLIADVEKSKEAYRYYKIVIEQAPSGIVPITVVAGKRFLGFVPDEIEQAVKSIPSTSSA